MWEIWVRSLGRKDPLEKEMAIHSSILAWRILWTGEPGEPQSMGSQRIGHDLVTKQQQYVNYIKVCSLGDWKNIDGIGGEKEDSRTNRFKREDCVLGFGPTGLEIIVMNQLCCWVSR